MERYLESVEKREEEQRVTNFNEVKNLFDKEDYNSLLSFCKGQRKESDEKTNKEKKLEEYGSKEIFEEYKNASPRLKSIMINSFAKDVGRQVISEQVFFEITGLSKCPQSGKKVLNKGNKIRGKAPDFHVMYKDHEYYGTQKLINGRGGAQDNQIEDTLNSAKESISNGKRELIAIDFRRGADFSQFEKLAYQKFGKDTYNKYIREELIVVMSTNDIINSIKKGEIININI